MGEDKTSAAKRLHDAYAVIRDIVTDHARIIGNAESERDLALHNYEGQKRNTVAFKDDYDKLKEKVNGLKWRVCEGELLRDPAIAGEARRILTEIANGL